MVIAMERSTLVHQSRRGASAPRILRGAQALALVVSRPSCNDASAAFGWSDFLVCGSCLVSPLPLRLSLGLAFPSWSSALRLSSWSRLLIPRLSSGLSFFGFRLVSPPHSAAFVWPRLANLGSRPRPPSTAGTHSRSSALVSTIDSLNLGSPTGLVSDMAVTWSWQAFV